MKETWEKITASTITVFFVLFICIIFVRNIEVPVSAAAQMYRGGVGTSVLGTFESRYNSTFPFKNAFVDINGMGYRALLKREMNGVYVLENGHITGVAEEAEEEILRANAEKIVDFAEWYTTEKGGNFVYMQIPHKNPRSLSQLPCGVVDYNNINADKFLSFLGDSVNKLDIRDEMEKDAVDHYAMFLKTEHHWNSYGGFYAFQRLCNYLIEQFGELINTEMLDITNYREKVLDATSLGYYGQRTGVFFADYEEFTLIYPTFVTQQTCTIPHRGIVRNGDFCDAIFDESFLVLPKRSRGLYGMYIGGDFPVVVHNSKTAENPGTIMMFIDSFGTIIESYLTTVYQNVIAIDLRWVSNLGWEETAVDFINEYEPDIVVVAYSPGQLKWKDHVQFEYGVVTR